jgi:hypothetical protein
VELAHEVLEAFLATVLATAWPVAVSRHHDVVARKRKELVEAPRIQVLEASDRELQRLLARAGFRGQL